MLKFWRNASYLLIDPVIRRLKRTLITKRRDSYDLMEMAQLRASFDTAGYFEEHMLLAKMCSTDLELLSFAAAKAPVEGLILEFGVASGRTIRHLAGARPNSAVFGFDSFQGLPEDWNPNHPKGSFAGGLPDVPNNVQLVKGWFSDTLPAFLETTPGDISILHIDCDLYSSTKYILDAIAPRLRPGTVIVFDEYFNFPGWRQHEYKAWDEFVRSRSMSYSYCGVVPGDQQVMVVLD